MSITQPGMQQVGGQQVGGQQVGGQQVGGQQVGGQQAGQHQADKQHADRPQAADKQHAYQPQTAGNTPAAAAQSSADQLVRFDNVSASYGGVTVLDHIDLSLMRGDVLAVLGRNGAGKTTLLNALFNLGPELGGRITVKGQAVTDWPTHRIARLGLALVPQGRGVFHTLAVHESLRLATLARGGSKASKASKVSDTSTTWTLDRVYREFPRLHERRLASSGALSGGERQMLALARALLTQADVIVLDEPSEGLAPLAVEEVLVHHVSRLAAEGLTVVLAEQNVAMALRVATRAVVLSAGRVVFDGTPAALAADTALHQAHLGV